MLTSDARTELSAGLEQSLPAGTGQDCLAWVQGDLTIPARLRKGPAFDINCLRIQGLLLGPYMGEVSGNMLARSRLGDSGVSDSWNGIGMGCRGALHRRVEA